MDALVVPADPQQPVRVIDLDAGDGSLANLQKAVGDGFVDVSRHREADIWVHDEGRLIDLPVNVRATHWALNDSALAKEGAVGEWHVLYGDVVVTGLADREGDCTAVDPALVEHFSSLQLASNAVDDWNTRSVGFTITSWRDTERGGRDDFGLGL